jgi:hypothetical protein
MRSIILPWRFGLVVLSMGVDIVGMFGVVSLAERIVWIVLPPSRGASISLGAEPCGIFGVHVEVTGRDCW